MAKTAYGWAHRQARKAALAALVDGTRCYYCRKPMARWMALDLDHSVPVALGGSGGPTRLVHRSCNSRAGAVLGNRLRSGKRRPVVKRRLPRW